MIVLLRVSFETNWFENLKLSSLALQEGGFFFKLH
jgi:hypothetical protein